MWVSAPNLQISTGSFEWNSANGAKQLAFPSFLSAIGRAYEIDLLFFNLNVQLAAPNNATNYWSYWLRIRPGPIDGSQFDPLETVVAGGATWRQFSRDLRGIPPLTSSQFTTMSLVPVGAPGLTIFNSSINYRIRLL